MLFVVVGFRSPTLSNLGIFSGFLHVSAEALKAVNHKPSRTKHVNIYEIYKVIDLIR